MKLANVGQNSVLSIVHSEDLKFSMTLVYYNRQFKLFFLNPLIKKNRALNPALSRPGDEFKLN